MVDVCSLRSSGMENNKKIILSKCRLNPLQGSLLSFCVGHPGPGTHDCPLQPTRSTDGSVPWGTCSGPLSFLVCENRNGYQEGKFVNFRCSRYEASGSCPWHTCTPWAWPDLETSILFWTPCLCKPSRMDAAAPSCLKPTVFWGGEGTMTASPLLGTRLLFSVVHFYYL
jgi:hypothetical protein